MLIDLLVVYINFYIGLKDKYTVIVFEKKIEQLNTINENKLLK